MDREHLPLDQGAQSSVQPCQGWGSHNFCEQPEWRKILPEPSLILSLSPYFFWTPQCVVLPEWPIVVPHALSVCLNLRKKISHWGAPTITSSWKSYVHYILHKRQRINNSLVDFLKIFIHKFFLPSLFFRYNSEWWKYLSCTEGFCK